jgi:hypothetical protein
MPLLVVVAIWLAYAPSLRHMPRCDQWSYLIDTMGRRGFADTFGHTYSYNRTRVDSPGDTDLFRPVLFALLAAEKDWFGNDFALAQAVGIGLHCGVVLLLLNILLALTPAADVGWPAVRIAGRLLPYAVCLFFALNVSVMEMVVWSHINGYLLFLNFLLGSVLLLLRAIDAPSSAGRRRLCLVGGWLLALAAAFTYELGQFYALLAGVCLACTAAGGRGLAARAATVAVFALIPAFYQGANYADQLAHTGKFPQEHLGAKILEQAVSGQTLEHAVRFARYTVLQPFFPSLVNPSPGDRIGIDELGPGELFSQPGGAVALSWTVVGVCLLSTLVGLRTPGTGAGGRRGITFAIGSGLFLLYAALSVLGRMNMRPGPIILSSNSYYAYLSLLFLLLTLAGLWQAPVPGQARASGAITCVCQSLLVVGLVLLSVEGARQVHTVNEQEAALLQPLRATVVAVQGFIDRHRHEGRLRVAFDLDNSDGIDVYHGIPITTILFHEWIDNADPSYVLRLRESQVHAIPQGAYRQAHPGCRPQLFPDLIQPGSYYNIFFYDGWYYGVFHWDGYYAPSRSNFACLIKDRTLAGALGQQSEKLAEQTADQRSGRFVPPGSSAQLLQEGYGGFNLVRYGNLVYAIPQGSGAFDVARINSRDYPIQFTGESIAEVRRLIDESPEKVPDALAPVTPTLIEEGYRGYNLLEVKGAFYGHRQGTGPFDFNKALHGDAAYVSGDSVEGVKGRIRRAQPAPADPSRGGGK